MANSKVIIGDEVLIDLEKDTVQADKLLKGYTAHDNKGEPVTGTCSYDADTSDATAGEAEILIGKTAYNKGSKVTGKMPNNGAVAGKITTKDGKYKVPQGYHDGSGTVEIDPTEQAKLIPENIRQGVTILDIEGNMNGQEDVKSQSKTVTPKTEAQTILPDSGYTHLSQVTVEGIPITRTLNSAGGYTVKIG